MEMAAIGESAQGQDDAEKDPPLRGAVDPGRIDQFVRNAHDILAKKEDARAHDDQGKDQPLVRIDPAQLPGQQVKGDDIGLERNQDGGDDQKKRKSLPRNRYLAKTIAAGRGAEGNEEDVETPEIRMLFRKNRTKGATLGSFR